MHHNPDWEAVGTLTFSKYGRARAWKRKSDKSSDDGFVTVPEQMEIPFENSIAAINVATNYSN